MGFSDCFSRGQSEEGTREVLINSGHLHHGYKGNYTSTTKYNLLTFLPKALFEQYRCVCMPSTRLPSFQAAAYLSQPTGCSSPQNFRLVHCTCRRIANIYFTIVAALSLTPYTPVR